MQRGRALRLILAAGPIACAGTTDPRVEPGWIMTPADGFAVAVTEQDTALAPVFLALGQRSRTDVAVFFNRPFRLHYVVRIFPDRVALAAHWREAWGAPQLDDGCWAIAAARRHEVTLLSPSRWREDACGHDARDTAHVRLVLAHELVHVLHDQTNSSLGRLANEMPWLVEGLAVYGSGQLEREYAAAVRALVAGGYSPVRLDQVWEGVLRYGVAGSVMGYVDQLAGRPRFTALLGVVSRAGVLDIAGRSEDELLAGWRASVAAGSSP